MNKTAIKNFSIWARRKLIADIAQKAGLMGITDKEIKNPLPQSTASIEFYDIGTDTPQELKGEAINQRKRLVEEIKKRTVGSNHKAAFEQIVEEVAYTWFNRLIAIRFMEVNDYIPGHVRVLSSESGKTEPDMVTNPSSTSLEFTTTEQNAILSMLNNNKTDELFRMLFVRMCNSLNEVLPKLFEVTNDYTELLLNLSCIDQDGVVYKLVHDIPEEDFDITKGGQVEIIGWLYQYYNTEPKDKVFADLKKNIKITKDKVPAATQLFTPDWIVRYMVENSLGRLWVEGHPQDNNLKAEWKYYLEEAKQEPEVQVKLEKIHSEYAKLKPEDIKVIDPCMGSGHILCYFFDILMQIYTSQGYTSRDAVESIVINNLYGLDLDDRASQLAYFAVMMKARQYDKRFLSRGLQPKVYAIKESNYLDDYTKDQLCDGNSIAARSMKHLLDASHDAKEYGSILDYSNISFESVRARLSELEDSGDLYYAAVREELKELINSSELLGQKYHVVVTNPPYMGSSGMSGKLSDFVKENYPNSKSDLFAVFIERCLAFTKSLGLTAMITQHAWMFLSTYEPLRIIMAKLNMLNMAHLGARAFDEIGGEVVQTTAFVYRKSSYNSYVSVYCRLLEPNTQFGKEKLFLSGNNRYIAKPENFSRIPGSPIAYWISEKIHNCFMNHPTLNQTVTAVKGLDTCDNDRFTRMWFEVFYNKIGLDINECAGCYNHKWFVYCKGGEFRRWYGNIDKIVDWENDGIVLRNIRDTNGRIKSRPQNTKYYFKEGITWSSISSYKLSLRYMNHSIFGGGGSAMFSPESSFYILGLLNSEVSNYISNMINPTLNHLVGDMLSLPLVLEQKNEVETIVKENISISKSDWDSFETSWDFKEHPLVALSRDLWDATAIGASMHHYYGCHPEVSCPLELCFMLWQGACNERFKKLKANEEELNRIFIDIYGLEDELTPEVEDDDVTVRKADLGRDIRSLISYAVGCMFGRYSLNESGLIYAGGEWNQERYRTFAPDADNVIPIADDEYLKDDIVGLFRAWIKKVFGEDSFDANWNYIANALGTSGSTDNEKIRNYFLKDFYKDHLKIYQKRPIYWLFDAGKQNSFKALIYLHRYDKDTLGNVRAGYLHEMQTIYQNEIEHMESDMENGSSARVKALARKRKEKLEKQLAETIEYDEKIAHLALEHIELDLDDGVKVNYRKLQTSRDGKLYEILANTKDIVGKDS